MTLDPNSKFDRLNNLYRIIDAKGNSVPFKLNPVQKEVLENLHTRNIILKARQLGMSTFSVLYLLDECIFNENLSCGIVSYSLEHAQYIYKKIIGHALDTWMPKMKGFFEVVQQSAKEIRFSNGSHLRVDTSLRGGSYQLVLVSEYGKTCARSPQKAEEVITGTLQTVPEDGRIIIESTGEGNEGFYAEMVNNAHLRGNDNLSKLEYKLFFFPWMTEARYKTEDHILIAPETNDYFDNLSNKHGIELTTQQKNWYAFQERILGDKIRQEFPSTISEAFLASSDAFYFAKSLAKAYETGRCLQSTPFDGLFPLYVAMDIGVNDLTAMIFFQVVHGEVRVIDYYEDKDKDVPFYAQFLLQDKKYLYHTIFLPHDSTQRIKTEIMNTYERDFKRHFMGTSTKFVVLKRIDKQISISHARIMIDRATFNLAKVKPLIDHMTKYRKKWSEATGEFLAEPFKNNACHASDAWQYVTQAVHHIETASNMGTALEKHKQAVDSRYRRVI